MSNNKSIKSIDKYGNICYKNENGKYHREDGPAIESSNGYKAWYINGKLHREDGPAVVWNNGDTFYFLNNIRYTKENWETEILNMRLKRIKDL